MTRGHRRRRIPLFSGHLHIVTSEKAYDRLMPKIPPLPPLIDGVFGQTVHTLYEFVTGGARQVVVIYVNVAALEPWGADQLIQTITHECIHAAALILDHVHHPLSGSDETLPYLTGWAIGEVIAACEADSGGRLRWKPAKKPVS